MTTTATPAAGDGLPTQTFRDAYEELDTTLVDIRGEAIALSEIGREHFSAAGRDNEAVFALIRTIEDKLGAALTLEDAVWAAGMRAEKLRGA